MKTLRFGTSLRYLVVTALVVLAPCLAHAGLLGDTVSATLTDVDSGNDIFSGSKVVGAGAEFSANFTTNFQSTWTLDLTDTGFTLTGTCSNDNLGCDFVSGLTLSISDLDFTPPADLTGLSGVTGITLPGLVVGTPTITTSSVLIEFSEVDLATGGPQTQTYSATFVTEPLAVATPLPATVALLGIGALAIGYRRFIARR